ncbi:hypothetical protein MAAFP003_2615 [Mycobacterium ahvazicum]|uniref:Uncharacterized protein n=1 Tax=Mycobacterium ahvazicum TaxID=1964395 RepID=A0A2K4YAX7_9MYCO|nr:hypothetical protein [Mycobacterium ahvazicum]SOX53939.1 hypothetical protein MAAFP003_2615 [Mycobacterium ahvazicum]
MVVLVLVGALATATSLGYYLGRRASSSPPTWRQRTSRFAMGRLALSFVVLVAARRIRQTARTHRPFRPADLKSVEPVELLRWSVALVLRRARLV